VFCERCAALTRRLTYDPLAGPHAELLTGSCIWENEASWSIARTSRCPLFGFPVWRTCWQQRRSALDFLSQFLRGAPANRRGSARSLKAARAVD
jgi:hypothetical protein